MLLFKELVDFTKNTRIMGMLIRLPNNLNLLRTRKTYSLAQWQHLYNQVKRPSSNTNPFVLNGPSTLKRSAGASLVL